MRNKRISSNSRDDMRLGSGLAKISGNYAKFEGLAAQRSKKYLSKYLIDKKIKLSQRH